MPLLNKKDEFVRQELPDGINADSEVFYLETTNECFTNYEEYFERMMLLNSCIWTCAITGRSGLTFDEAKESEKESMVGGLPYGILLS